MPIHFFGKLRHITAGEESINGVKGVFQRGRYATFEYSVFVYEDSVLWFPQRYEHQKKHR